MEDDGDNIVSKVESKEVDQKDVINFDKEKKDKRKIEGETEDGALPKSLMERYASDIKLTRKE